MSGKIYITGDTHGDYKRLKNQNDIIFRPEDKLIILGDFGFLFQEQFSREMKTLRKMKQDLNNIEILFIDGNHDNFHKLKELPTIDRYNSNVGKVMDGIYYLKRGNIYEINGYTFFTMGGQSSIDKHMRIMDVDWWEDEIIKYSDIENGLNNLNKYNKNVDFVLTHTCPQSILDKIYEYSKRGQLYDPCSRILEEFKEIIEIKYEWIFGHLHMDYQINDKFIQLYEMFRII